MLLDVSAGDADAVWNRLGSLTTSRGLDLKFDHDDDPQAEATLLLAGVADDRRSMLANRRIEILEAAA